MKALSVLSALLSVFVQEQAIWNRPKAIIMALFCLFRVFSILPFKVGTQMGKNAKDGVIMMLRELFG